MLHPRVVSDLCRFPMWLIDWLSVDDGDQTVILTGWALPYHGDVMAGEIRMNGKKPDNFERRPSPDLVDRFKWESNIEVSRYLAVFRNLNLSAEDLLRFSYTGRSTGDPFNRWQDIYFPLRVWLHKLFVEPDEPRMARTQGDTSFLRYIMYGTTIAQTLDEVTKTYFGRSLADFDKICD